MDEKTIFEFLQRKYGQSADARQKALGLVYMTAETHDLAKEIARLFVAQGAKVQALLDHCPEGECDVCAKIICPYECTMHFHHDGCPACAENE